MIGIGYYQSIERGQRATIITLLRGVVFMLIGFFALPPVLGVPGIWRAYYHKDGADATIWFASDGEAAFSVWGYADNAYSLINIEAMCDSVAYSISRATLNQLYHSFTGLTPKAQ